MASLLVEFDGNQFFFLCLSSVALYFTFTLRPSSDLRESPKEKEVVASEKKNPLTQLQKRVYRVYLYCVHLYVCIFNF